MSPDQVKREGVITVYDMSPDQVKREGVITVYDRRGELTAIVIKDEKSRKSVFYQVSEMGFDEIEQLLKNSN